MIPYGRQSISDDDIAAVIETLKSDWLTQGPAVPRFEAALCAATGADHAVAVNSATSALHIACLALGLGPGDIAWTVPNTFVASANCALYCGATVDFVDIDPASYNMDTAALEAKLASAEAQGRLPKVLIPVHFGGHSCDMKEIAVLAARYGFHVIEDASHAIGGAYDGGPVGDCRYSDICVFSFHPVKIVTTGEGGAAMTNDPALAEAMRLLRSHGITRDLAVMRGDERGSWVYEQHALGFNYRMTDIAAALGASQMKRLDEFVAKRTALADRYDVLLGNLPVGRPPRRTDRNSAWHLYAINLEAADDNGTLRAHVFEHMRAAGVGVNVHYIPVHFQPYYRALGFRHGEFPGAEKFYARALTLPLFPDLTPDDQDKVVATLKEALA
ncbi:UDP-4-amino-4,6-dideoxy-N-acetyl-beta-L-altrosamine transaminase [Parvibaculum sp.]|uniref:UDP-4-amino-4, 6-dideoxy-N-acetyl-beta-L-altrosamine transaminase n=1 Tax=Parvibaculum sp. TaxID=2024848 RepID=UPI001DC7FDB6|nr:UDP-4-amino-4,6-dideoxy-N-acetyl-beta-L-altrosamine transaminase [Parvibaculum sp.]MBX3489163.1 UDP-4-amino-4,6-dideoxy-N-acetyl-beta-L-altrosamine transaminase [Parvibaculum sp.]MCW5726964.1 UDP-4-amino-4,6-dideoxy-N-acetyl-beta-L-altrosamine transaminase [Parvibaculum sp.]